MFGELIVCGLPPHRPRYGAAVPPRSPPKDDLVKPKSYIVDSPRVGNPHDQCRYVTCGTSHTGGAARTKRRSTRQARVNTTRNSSSLTVSTSAPY